MENQEEIWRPVLGYEGFYDVSNFGRIKSLNRITIYKNGKKLNWKEKILILFINKYGYYHVRLCRNGKCKTKVIHQLVAKSFLGDSNLYVNHKDSNKSNNNICNLEFVTARENCNHYHSTTKKSSKYPGVCWHKNYRKWQVGISINGITKYLGRFNSELEAANEYKKYIDQYENK